MKKILGVLLGISMTLTFPQMSFAAELADVNTSPYKIEIEKLVEDGIINGYEDNTFRPESYITRGEVSKILVEALDMEEDPASASHFVDVTNKWHQGYVGALYKAGIFIGTSETTFSPENNVTRQELAVILTRIFDYETIANDLVLDTDFLDKESVANWATKSVDFTYKIDLIKCLVDETGNEKFEPNLSADRQLVAKLVYELKYNKPLYEEKIIALVNNNESLTEEILELIDELGNDKNEDGLDGSKDDDKDPVSNVPTYESIVSRYESELSSLEDSVKSKLSDLLSEAKDEVFNTNTPISDLIDKYMSKADSLESDTDSKVADVLSSLEDELSEHGYETDVIDSLNNRYESIKDNARDEYSPF